MDLAQHMAWSGMTSYDMDKPRQLMGLVPTVLHEVVSDGLPRYLNQDLLRDMGPVRAPSSTAPCAPSGKTPSPADLTYTDNHVTGMPERPNPRSRDYGVLLIPLSLSSVPSRRVGRRLRMFAVEIRQPGQAWLVSLRGELDFSSAVQLREAVRGWWPGSCSPG